MQAHTCLNHHTTKRQWSRVEDDEVLAELGKPGQSCEEEEGGPRE